MPLGTEVGLRLRDIVLDGDPALSPLKGHAPPNFRPMSVVAKRLDGLRCHLVWRPRLGRLCFQWGPSYRQKKGTPTATHFLAHDASLYGSRPRLWPHYTGSQLSAKGGGHSSPAPLFGPCLLWPRSPISPTAELLLNFS